MKSVLSLFLLVVAVGAVGGAPSWGVAPDGTVWTEHSKRFQFAPTLAFQEVKGAVAYHSEVIDDFHETRTVTSSVSCVDLASVWDGMPVGYFTVICRGVDGAGAPLGEAGRRKLWKKAAFKPARYPSATMSYRLAQTRIFENYLTWPQTRHLAETGDLDIKTYPLNGYPSKMLAAEIVGLCDYIGTGIMKNDADRLLALARRAGDLLIAYSVPAGQPLAYFPRTYHERGSEYGRFKGEQDRIHLVYPAKAGFAFVTLYRTVKDKKYLEAAERIGQTYLRLQEPDGTWPMQLNARTGERYNTSRLVPLDTMFFLEALAAETGNADYRAASDRAFAFLENGPLKNWNWEGQFEDGAKLKVTTHKNLSNFPANMMASYLLKRFPGDPVRIAQAEALCRFVEDQFVDWEPPYDHGRNTNEYGREDDGSWRFFCRPTANWCTPVVLEQYACYVPVDASAAKTIQTLIDVYEATKNPVYLAKARAIADAQTRMIEPDGFINTWSVKGVRRDDHRHHTWLNCTMEIMCALGRLGSFDSE